MKTKFKFIKYTKLWFLMSSILILIGVAGLINNKISTGNFLNLGIDFTGGTLMEIEFPDSQTDKTTELRTLMPEAQIIVTNENSYIIQTQNIANEKYEELKTKITNQIGKYEEIRYTSIGPKIGDTLKKKAIVALAIALIAIVIYIAYAFRYVPKRVSPWKFGVCAIAALLHDVFITLGIFAVLNYKVDAFFITALLTILGFSVHDTIVVFDRVRENLKSQGRNDSFSDIADLSLNQTLTRSLNTSLSTLFTLTALYFLGAESIRVFVFALIIGIFVGTYSSIFIATPLLSLWQNKRK